MRKLLIPVLFIILLNTSVQAQSDSAFASARYTLTHIMDTTQPDNPSVSKMILYLGKNMSSYSFDRANGNVSGLGVLRSVTVDGVTTSVAPSTVVSPLSTIGNYYKIMNTSHMALMAYAGGKLFAVQEKIPVIEWSITQETKNILGLQCQKAVGDFKGRTYEAWFANQLPYSNGPWKLGGLPGLIIEASDTKKEVVFKLTSFENITGVQTAIGINPTALKTTFKEFNEYQEALKRDRDAGITNNTSAGGMITFSGTIRSGGLTGPDGKPVKPTQMNNPIEKVNN